MKKLFTCLILSLFSLTQAFAVSGHITSNTTWTTNQIVTGDLYIDAGVTLTISAGVVVTFPFVDQNMDGIGDIDFIINGRLQVQGTPASKVYFKSNEAAPGKKDWGGIDYLTASTGELSVLSNVEILNAYEGILINGRNLTFNACRIADCFKAGLTILSTIYTTTFNNSIIENCDGYGLLHQAGTIMINGLTIIDCGQFGFKALSGTDINATNLVISNNGEEGIWVENTNTATFNNCKVVSNAFDGIRVTNDNPAFDNCLVKFNGRNGILVTNSASVPSFNHCTIEKNYSNGFLFMDGSGGTITYSSIIHNPGAGIAVIENSLPSIENCNIFANSIFSVEIIPSDQLVDNSGYYKSYLPMVIGLTQFRVYGHLQHPLSSMNSIEDNFGNTIAAKLSGSNVWVGASQSGNSVIRTYTNDWASLAVFEIGYSNNRTQIQLATSNSAGVINAQYNYWGQINGINDRIFQNTAGTIAFSNYSATPISGAGCNLANDVPSIELSQPSSFLIDPDSVVIKWIDQDLDDNAMISLYRFKQSDTFGTLIATNIYEDDRKDSLVWNLSSVPDGTYRIYAEISDGTNITRDTLWTATVQVGGLKAIMPQDAFGVPGTYVEVPLKTLNTITYYNIISYQFSLAYNSSLINAVSIESTGTLSENWQVFANTSIPGQITVNGYSTTPLTTDGSLIKIVFLVNSNATNQSTSPLTFLDFTFNAGNPTQTTENGLFTVKQQYLIAGHTDYYFNSNAVPGVKLTTTIAGSPLSVFSDINGTYSFPLISSGNYAVEAFYDEEVPPLVITPFDASITARYALSLYSLTNAQQKAADVDGNNLATVFDAALMAQYSVGLIDSFPAGKWIIDPPLVNYTLVSNLGNQNYALSAVGDPSGNWVSPVPPTIKQSIRKPQDSKSQLVYIPIKATEPFYSYLLDVEYNPQKLTYIGLEKDNKLDNFQETTNSYSGRIRVGAYGINPVNIDGTAIRLVFQANNYGLADLEVTCLFDEKIGVITDVEENMLPLSYLSQNQPNPFSATTHIGFGTDRKQQLRIELYDIQGRFIKELINAQYSPGSYSLQLNTDELGSGLYLYTMFTETGLVITRKLSILK